MTDPAKINPSIIVSVTNRKIAYKNFLQDL